MSDLPIAFRPAQIDDFNYIMSSWLQHYHKTTPTNFIPNPIYFPHQSKVITSLLQHSPTIVCCLDDEPNNIVGYLVYQPHSSEDVIVHWGCIKGIYRRMGILKELLERAGAKDKTLICTHYFDLFPNLKEKYHLIYDPTLLQELVHVQ